MIGRFFTIFICLACFSFAVAAQTNPPSGQQTALDKINTPVSADGVSEVISQIADGSIFARDYFTERGKVPVTKCLREAPSSSGVSNADWREKYSARFIYCMRDLLEKTTDTVMNAVHDYMQPALYAIILLATVIMGTKAVGGMFRNTKVESVMFVGKVIAAILVFEHMDDIASLFYDVTDELMVIVAGGAEATFNSGSVFICNTSINTSAYPLYEWIGIFDWFDCLFYNLYGFGPSQVMTAGIFGIIGAGLLTSTIGAHFTLMALGFFLALAMFLLRTATMVVMAYGSISILMLLMPIFILTIFFKVTESYFFQRWLSMMIRNIMQPAVMIAFLYFALGVLDVLLYKGSENHYINYGTTYQNAQNIGWIQRISDGEVFADIVKVGNGATPPSGYTKLVEPVHEILGTTVNMVSADLSSLTRKEKIFEFEVEADSVIFQTLEQQCGVGKITDLVTGAVSILTVRQMLEKADSSGALDQLVSDPTAFLDSLEGEVDSGEIKDLGNKGIEISCSIARMATYLGTMDNKLGDIARQYLNKKINSPIPEVSKLDLSATTTDTFTGDTAWIHSQQLIKLIIAMVTLMVVGGVLFSYTNQIQRIAAAVTGRMGLSLSVNSPTIGGKTIQDRVRGSLNALEDGWTQSINDKNSTLVDRMGWKGVKDAGKQLVSGRG